MVFIGLFTHLALSLTLVPFGLALFLALTHQHRFNRRILYRRSVLAEIIGIVMVVATVLLVGQSGFDAHLVELFQSLREYKTSPVVASTSSQPTSTGSIERWLNMIGTRQTVRSEITGLGTPLSYGNSIQTRAVANFVKLTMIQLQFNGPVQK